MAMAVQLHPVPGGDDLRRQGRPALHLLAGEEEGGPGAVVAKGLQRRRRPLRVRPLVEGDRDPVQPLLAQDDAERAADRRQHRRQGRPGLGDGRRTQAGRRDPAEEAPPQGALLEPAAALSDCCGGVFSAAGTIAALWSLSAPMWMRPVASGASAATIPSARSST